MQLPIDYREYFAMHVQQFTVRGNQATGLCPFHDDQQPSLSLNLTRGLFCCHACGVKGNVVQFQALLQKTDTKDAYKTLMQKYAPPQYDVTVSSYKQNAAAAENTTVYPYCDQQGTVLYELVRLDTKAGKRYFYRHTPEGARTPIHKKPAQRVPYNLPGILAAGEQGGLLFIVEGEKCAQTLMDHGLLATTTGSASSAEEWTPEYTNWVKPFSVVLCPDYDRPGKAYMQALAAKLSGKVRALTLLELWNVFPNMNEKDDIADLLERGVPVEEIIKAAQGAAPPMVDTGATLLEYPLNDLGNANRLLALQAGQMRYCPGHGKWYCWDGGRWLQDSNNEATRRAIQMTEKFREASLAGNLTQQRFALSAGNMSRIDAMLKAAAAISMVEEETLDARDDLLCMGEKTLELDTGRQIPSNPTHWNTRKLRIKEPQSNTQCPEFLTFLDRIFGGDQQLIAYIQRALGYCMTGSTREQVFFIAYGDGANGKSTLIDLVAHILGDYAATIPAEALLGFSRGGASPELASAVGARLLTVNESGDSCRLNEGLIKQLTGGDLVYARPLYSQGFTYRPRFKIWMSTNHKPLISGTDLGIWRRVHLIPFTVSIPQQEMDKRLPEKLRAEAPGIFRWLCEGARLWYQNGLQPPAQVTAAVKEYKNEMDRIDEFLATCILEQPEARIPARVLYAAYEEYCSRYAAQPRSQTMFGRRLSAMGYEKIKTPATYYIGMELCS